MADLVPIALAGWVVLSVALFWKLPGRDAALIALIGGWAVLPIGRYPASGFLEPLGHGGSVHAVAIPTDLLVNKATAIGLGCLIGAMIFGWPALRRVRPSWVDLPVVVWCLVPVASAMSNGLPIIGGLAQSRYLVLVWGVPYLMGRAYLGDSEGLRRLGVGFVVAGVVAAPLCLAEFFAGPFLYGLIYGPHPYQSEGSARWLGFRPLVFQEHGNQLGMWVASAAVAAVWLWRSDRLPVPERVHAWALAAVLAVLCLLCQSHTALAVAALAVAPALLPRRGASASVARRRPVAAIAGCVVVVALVLAGVGFKAAGDPAARNLVRGAFSSAGKASFTWRLARSEEHLRLIAERPALGWGRADWSYRPGGTFVNPVNLGLWLHATGMYGVVGLVSSTALLLLPAASALRRLPPRVWLSPAGSAVALAAVLLLMNLVDSLFNSTWILPLTAAAGGLSGWSARQSRGEPGHARAAWETERSGFRRSTAEA